MAQHFDVAAPLSVLGLEMRSIGNLHGCIFRYILDPARDSWIDSDLEYKMYVGGCAPAGFAVVFCFEVTYR